MYDLYSDLTAKSSKKEQKINSIISYIPTCWKQSSTQESKFYTFIEDFAVYPTGWNINKAE